jgi:hypothetical protein
VPVDVLAYQKDFDRRRARIILPPNSEEIGPTIENVGFYSWILNWVIFLDGKKHYLRVWERWERRAGLSISRRISLSYHYGPTPRLNKSGMPDYIATDPVEIRVDNSCQPIHLHYKTQQPHYSQDRITGLELESLDPFRFTEAILKHRADGTSLDRVLGFKLK